MISSRDPPEMGLGTSARNGKDRFGWDDFDFDALNLYPIMFR